MDSAAFTEALGVDVGAARIGIARVNAVARIPSPIKTVKMSETAIDEIREIAERYSADLLVVGLPSGVRGDDTEQSVYSREFAAKLEAIGIPVILSDETLSTKQAERMLAAGTYKNNEIGEPVGLDEAAACVILNDFIGENSGF